MGAAIRVLLLALVVLGLAVGLRVTSNSGERVSEIVASATNTPTPPLPTSTPTPVSLATPPVVEGFQFQLGKESTHRVRLGPIPEVFEDHPRAQEIPTQQTGEGQMAGGNLARLAGNQLPLRDIQRRQLGTWLGWTITDTSGRYSAMRLGYPRPDWKFPSNASIEGVVRSAVREAVVEGPNPEFKSWGVSYFPPEIVSIRGFQGILLRQARNEGAVLPAVQTLVWREGDMYWMLRCWDLGDNYFTVEYLLEVARQGLVHWDTAAQTWVEVR